MKKSQKIFISIFFTFTITIGMTVFAKTFLQYSHHKNKTLKITKISPNIQNFAPQICITKININNLIQIKGIGKNLASKIIQYQKKHNLQNIEDLEKIKGISNKKAKYFSNYLDFSC